MISDTRTALVTGGAGFIGSLVVHRLADAGWHVRVLDDLSRADPVAVDRLRSREHVELVVADVRDRQAVAAAVDGVAAVAHLAAVCINQSVADPRGSMDINAGGSTSVFEAAADVGARVVFASSASVYGEPRRLPMSESDDVAPVTPYCIAKYSGEQLLRFFGERRGLSWMALRFFNVYGPGQPTDAYYTSVVLTFLRRLAAGEPPVIDGDGSQTMDFVHSDDVARAVVMAMRSDVSGEIVNIGTGAQTSIAELAGLLVALSGSDQEPQFRPRPVIVSRRAADVSRAAAMLGWEPRIPVEEGLVDTVAWLLDRSPTAAGVD